MNSEFNQTLLIYGIVNGINFAAFLYVALHYITLLFVYKKPYMRLVICSIMVGFLCISCLNFIFQYAYHIPITNLYPEYTFSVSKFALSIILFLLTLVYIRSISIQSFHCYDVIERYKTLIALVYFICFMCFVGAFYSDSPTHLMLLGCINIIPITLILSYISYKTIVKSYVGKLFIAAFMSTAVTSLLLLILFVSHVDVPVFLLWYIQFFFALVFICLSFLTTRHGTDSIMYYFDIIKNQGHLIPEVYDAIKNEQFFVVYEPVLNLTTGEVCSLNAIIRWKHPLLGILSEEDFLDIANKTNMMHTIYAYCINLIAQQATEFEAIQSNLPISLRLASKNIHPNLVYILQTTLNKYNLSESLFVIELTEDFLIKQNDKQAQAIAMLRDMNVKLSIGNYGTGFSSLHYLRSLSLYSMSIDKSFIQNIDSDHDNSVLIQSTVQMMQGLNIQVIADGVDDSHVMTLLKELGCVRVKGKAVATAMDSSTLIYWMHANDNLRDGFE